METIQQQIGALQLIVQKQQAGMKRQRFAIIALAGIIVAGGFVAAVRPAGDATFDTITCKGWKVVDKDGKIRINASTLANGDATVQLRDKDRKIRIDASTNANGSARMTWSDKDGNMRIDAATLTDGTASVTWIDKDGKMRINAATETDGDASVYMIDKDGKFRIKARTSADGTVALPTEDLNPPKKP